MPGKDRREKEKKLNSVSIFTMFRFSAFHVYFLLMNGLIMIDLVRDECPYCRWPRSIRKNRGPSRW